MSAHTGQLPQPPRGHADSSMVAAAGPALDRPSEAALAPPSLVPEAVFTAPGPPDTSGGHAGPTFGTTERRSGRSVVVSVAGEVDIATTGQLGEALGVALRLGGKGLVCDLTGVGFLGASGVRELLIAGRRAVAAHIWFDVVCPQPLPRRVITLTGLDTAFALHDTVAGAVGSQDRRPGRPGIGPPPEPADMVTVTAGDLESRFSPSRSAPRLVGGDGHGGGGGDARWRGPHLTPRGPA